MFDAHLLPRSRIRLQNSFELGRRCVPLLIQMKPVTLSFALGCAPSGRALEELNMSGGGVCLPSCIPRKPDANVGILYYAPSDTISGTEVM